MSESNFEQQKTAFYGNSPTASGLYNNDFSKTKAYPNPAQNQIVFDLKGLTFPSNSTIKLMNDLGLVVGEITIESDEQQLDISYLINGIYFYEISNNLGEPISKGKFLKFDKG